MSDHRERALLPSCVKQDHGRRVMLITDGDDNQVEHPAAYRVCPDCDGSGSYVNPSIDSHGLSAEDFEDPDFAEDYRSGVYDVECRTCNGMRVILWPTGEDGQELLAELIEGDRQSRAEDEAERRMGA